MGSRTAFFQHGLFPARSSVIEIEVMFLPGSRGRRERGDSSGNHSKRIAEEIEISISTTDSEPRKLPRSE